MPSRLNGPRWPNSCAASTCPPFAAEGVPSAVPATAPPTTESSHKRCSSCDSWLPLDQFGRDSHQPSGYTKSCRDCRRRCYRRNRPQARLRDAKSHQTRRAENYRARFDALVAALPDPVLDRLPDVIRPTPMQRRLARAAARKRAAGLPVTR